MMLCLPAWSQRRGDLNVDGMVDVTDVSELIDIILGKSQPIPDPPGPNNAQTFMVKGVTFKMVPIEGGTFNMGATSEQTEYALTDEYPVHQVTLSCFYMGATEVTQELWQAVMGSNPSEFTDDLQCPVEKVSWDDCQTFIAKLNELTGRKFRLPTEAEWEFAARGGNKTRVYEYSGSNTIDDVAWYSSNSASTTHPVATKAPNELGLYDMTGNVWEWCSDWYKSYSDEPQTNPTGATTGDWRVYRGGSWRYGYWVCHVS